MPFDPSIISQIPDFAPNPAEAIGKGIQLKDLANTQQLNQLRLNEVKKSHADEAKASEIFKSAKYDTQEGVYNTMEKLTRAGLQKQALEFGSMAQKYQSGQVEQETKVLERDAAEHDVISGSLDSVMSRLNDLKDRGATAAELDAAAASFAMPEMNRLAAQYKDNPRILERIRGFAEDPKNLSYEGIDAAERQSNKGQQILKERLAERKQVETERENRARDDRGEQAIGIQQKKASTAESSSFTAEDGELMGALAERGVSLPAGLRSKSQQISILRGLKERNPDLSADQLADKIKSGQETFAAEKKEITTAAGVAGRVSVAQNEIKRFAPIVLEKSAAVDRGRFVPINKLLQFGDSQVSDPKLKQLKISINSLLNAYDQLAARGGTDKEKRAEVRSLLTSADSPEALKSGLDIFLQEAEAAEQGAQDAMAPMVQRRQSQEAPKASAASSISEGATATGANGEKIVLRNGKWVRQ